MHLLQKRQVGGNKRSKKTNVNKTCSPFPVRIFLCYEEDEYFISNIFLRPYSRELLYKIFFFFFFNVSLHLTIFFFHNSAFRSIIFFFPFLRSNFDLCSLISIISLFLLLLFLVFLSLSLLLYSFLLFLFHVRSGFVSRSFAEILELKYKSSIIKE